MQVEFTPEQESQLSQIATQVGIATEQLVQDAALRMLAEEAHFHIAVQEGLAQADRGELIEEDEMNTRLRVLCSS